MMETRDIGTREGYDLWAETYEESPNPVVAMDARHTLGILAPAPGERILDAGCGTGRYLGEMISAGSHPTGMDFSGGMLRVARQRYPDVPLNEADLQSPFPFDDGSFDAVLCALLGEHLDDPLFALREMQRVLKPGGRLVFSVYHPEMAATGVQAHFEKAGIIYRLGANRYTVTEYENWIGQAGLKVAKRHEFVGDEQLVENIPFATWLVGFPVLLVIEATKES